MAKNITVAVVGCGYFAQNHLNAWASLKSAGADLVAVCDVDPAKSNAAAQAFGVKAYTDLDAMLAHEKLGLVDVVTQMGSHLAIAAKLAAQKIPTILQKPLAPDWADSCRIADLAEQNKNFLAVHENFRFQAPTLRAKALIDAGVIGTPSWARFSFRTAYDVYKNQPYFYTEERLAILDVGIHVLDLARLFLGEATRVSCETQKRNPKVRAEDTATMLLAHETGAVSVVECTYEARRLPDLFPHTRLEIEGPLGSLVLNSDDELVVTQNGVSHIEKIHNPLDAWMTAPFHVMQRSVTETNRSILVALQNGARAPTDIIDNMKTFALVEAAYASVTNRRAEVPKVWSSNLS